MGALKILQNQFEQRSVEFPNMRGVWIQWKPISEATHSPIVIIISGGNIIDAWSSYGSGGCRYDSGLDMYHLLFKPEKSTWDTDIVRGLFKTLAQKTWVELRKMKTETARRGLSKAGNLSDPVEQWLIAVHEILGSKKRACDHQESNVIWEQGNSRIVWSPERDTTKPVCRILDCVFLDSALACSMLLEQPQAKVSFAEFVQRLHPNKIDVLSSRITEEAEHAVATDKSKQKTETQKNTARVQEPLLEAVQAYQLYYGTDKNQTEVAEIMTEKLHKPVSQGQVSKWVNQYEKWAKANNIPIPEKPTIVNMNGNKLDMGARTDGKRTGDPHHKAKVDPDSDADE